MVSCAFQILLLFSLPPRAGNDVGSLGSGDHAPSRFGSLTRIDPSRIVPMMIKRGGLVLPQTIETDLKILESVCHCDDAYLDVYNRELEIRNFTINATPPKSKEESRDDDPVQEQQRKEDAAALRIGRIRLKWDSYLRPCVDVQVEDVKVLVGFRNVLLSKNNWGELQSVGFPPLLLTGEPTTDEGTSDPAPSSSFVRVGSVQLSGEVGLRVYSHPLDKTICPDIVFDLAMIQDLNERIEEVALRAESESGRRGCTTDDLYDIVRVFFVELLKKALGSTLIDLAVNRMDGSTGQRTRRIWSEAKGSAVQYANSAADKFVWGRLGKMGLSEEAVGAAKSAAGKILEILRTQAREVPDADEGEERDSGMYI